MTAERRAEDLRLVGAIPPECFPPQQGPRLPVVGAQALVGRRRRRALPKDACRPDNLLPQDQALIVDVLAQWDRRLLRLRCIESC